MDVEEFKALSARLEQVGRVLEKLPAEVRSDAFDLLKAYVTGQPSDSPAMKGGAKAGKEDSETPGETFFASFNHDKPADNARLIAAFFYGEYGVEPFSVDEVRQKAADVGVTIPERVDMTFGSARKEGKSLFARAGKGKFRPTVYGEAYLKTTYSVRKGTKKREESAE